MNPIDRLFRQSRKDGRKAFIPFLTAGDPDLGFTEKLLPRLAEAGADLIEIGFPFSDPIADGPVIQASYTRALERDLKLKEIFAAIDRVTKTPGWTVPIVGMVSYSLVHRHGPALFLDHAKEAGFSGAIVPDLTAEEADDFAKLASDRDFKLILLVTPTTPPARVERIVKLCTGFLYCVSVVGITGERDRLPEALREQLRKFRTMTDLPLCVGFGVGKPDQVKELRQYADGVIVGSALVRKLENARQSPKDAADDIINFVRELAGALHD
ncbi:MAG: tryptophan synthase subunit alpha [Planctomycetes bacterium]|nr:tryptophan synthase subunit alpha [Planctomycetota bacterium]